MATTLLLYTARDERDVLGHAIGFLEHGTFTHSALIRNGILVEAVIPRVRLLTGTDAQHAYDGASARIELQTYSEELEERVWNEMVKQQVGQPYSLTTLLADALGNFIGQQVMVNVGMEVVCSALCWEYARLNFVRQIPTWSKSADKTPADLGQAFLGIRGVNQPA